MAYRREYAPPVLIERPVSSTVFAVIALLFIAQGETITAGEQSGIMILYRMRPQVEGVEQ